jgi:hypothetical protein
LFISFGFGGGGIFTYGGGRTPTNIPLPAGGTPPIVATAQITFNFCRGPITFGCLDPVWFISDWHTDPFGVAVGDKPGEELCQKSPDGTCVMSYWNDVTQTWELAPPWRSAVRGPSADFEPIATLLEAQERAELFVTNRVLIPGGMFLGGVTVFVVATSATVTACATVVGCVAALGTVPAATGGLWLAYQGGYYALYQRFNPNPFALNDGRR